MQVKDVEVAHSRRYSFARGFRIVIRCEAIGSVAMGESTTTASIRTLPAGSAVPNPARCASVQP